ncbi:MAG: hypothetical protein LBT13_11655 [Treponema sp.]|nr:hypothetical protein [Treponema sp.]
MTFTLEPAAPFAQQLNLLIMKATFDVANEWFFVDGAFNSTSLEQSSCNTWLYEKFVAVSNGKIFAYFDGTWSRPLDIIVGFRTINFNKEQSRMFVRALFMYFDYLFVNRGCQAFNWMVALQNKYALMQYERFIKDYCGHKIGTRIHAQKSYTGIISDINLYELTRKEYFDWKDRNFTKR